MSQIIEVEPTEARKWLKNHPSWEFVGEVNKISHKNLLEFVNDLYKAGSEKVFISEYVWEIEPVYEGDELKPDLLLIELPKSLDKRSAIIETINKSLLDLEAKQTYEDKGSTRIWYFLEPKPHEITVGSRRITWYK